MMDYKYIKLCKSFSEGKLKEFIDRISEVNLHLDRRACVYATGSFGRLEAGPSSDLDLFIVSKMEKQSKDGKDIDVRLLTGIEEIKLQYTLVSSAEHVSLPEFDGDGRFLKCHDFDNYVKYLGGPDDDAKNTLTGRLLLLLESRPLIGIIVYEQLISHVLDRYFIDYSENKQDFVPAFLFNDIIRMWRTFCVNYEYSRKLGSAKSKIKNLKLKYSRMLTCYSALLYLLSVFQEKGTVCPADVRAMISHTPTDRLLRVKEGDCRSGVQMNIVSDAIECALMEYSEFLQFTHENGEDILAEYDESSEIWRNKSYKFGEYMEVALSEIGRPNGKSSRLYRIILI